MITNQTKNQHLFWRAGFGPAAEDIQKFSALSNKQLYAAIVKASAAKPVYIDVAKNIYDGLVKGIGSVINMEEVRKELQDNNKRQQFQKRSREAIKSLNIQWLDEMVNTNAQLREKMAFFWHGHFACRNLNIFFQQLLLDDIRNNALGSFKDLLTSVSKSAAMLAFLNNQQNKKQSPNENFAREVMELFTMARGNYTEKDVKEAARAFTGWGFDTTGEFVFRKFQHDSGSKTFLGKTGNFTGDDIIEILLEQKQTANYITSKVYRFFVNENVDTENVQWLSKRFYESGYDISGLMSDIFTSKWFFEEKNIGKKIKSPIELIAGIRRLLPMDLENDEVQLLMQRTLGQILFYPPNVAGWPGGSNWIDSSSLMLRMRLPQLIKENEVFAITPKTDDDQQMGMKDETKEMVRKKADMKAMRQNDRFRINADVKWEQFAEQLKDVPREHLADVLESVVLQTKSGSLGEAAVQKMADASSRAKYIETVTIALMSTPEYQLC